jgi:hypothetical protein
VNVNCDGLDQERASGGGRHGAKVSRFCVICFGSVRMILSVSDVMKLILWLLVLHNEQYQ